MAHQDPNQDPQDPNVEEPGDTDAADIVDRTGEQMPRQQHDGVDDEERPQRKNDNPRAGRISDW